MAEVKAQQSKRKERGREIDELRKKIEEGKEKTKESIDMLTKELTLVEKTHKIVKDAENEKEQRKNKRKASVTFAIKAAHEKNPKIETQITEYIIKKIPKDNLEINTTWDWKNRKPDTPLVVFCNYSSRIGVDVQVSLKGVEEPKVILIILHYIRRALIKGDLSDDDYLLSDNLKERAVCIAHFAFDDDLYDCHQNRCSRNRLCNDLIAHFETPSKENT
ncbi:uncharacterized protein LOC116300613 [Actinia tenebrosa]|uniref:Uncharacterized protein LOC116300613 n=1 Tax=Actinia tenebrosa TaxID=6105 RepID=A0A6P8IF76_ACTTE|nr:uncharacterized protein LOC116300613 [Actinia tenebrosa]